MNGVCNSTFFWPAPWGPGEGPKGQISLNIIRISNTKSISKILKPNFVCLLTNERYKTYQTEFSFGGLGHALGVGLGGTVGVGRSNFFIFFQKFNQILCVSYLHEWHMQQHHFFDSPPPGALERGQKVKYH